MFSLHILLTLLPVVLATNPNCSTYSACSCNLVGVGLIDLSGFKDGPNDYIELDGLGRSTYRFYPCGLTVPWGTGSCGATATLCEYNVYADEYYSLGETAKFEIPEAVPIGTDSYIVFMYSGGTEERESYVTVKCSTTGTNEFDLLEDFRNSQFFFEFKSPKACPVPVPANGRGNAPALFICVVLVLFLATITYLVVGVMLMVFWKGARGLEIIPNLVFWKDLPFLLKDGILFCFSCFPAMRSRIGRQKIYSSLK